MPECGVGGRLRGLLQKQGHERSRRAEAQRLNLRSGSGAWGREGWSERRNPEKNPGGDAATLLARSLIAPRIGLARHCFDGQRYCPALCTECFPANHRPVTRLCR